MIATDSQKVEKDKKIFIIGDLLVDKTCHVEVTKISPEAPINVANLIQKETVDTPGGAGLGAAFAAKEGIESIFGTYCNGNTKDWLKEEFKVKEIITVNTEEDNIFKKRYIDKESGYHLIRIDNDPIVNIPLETKEEQKEWDALLKNTFKKNDIGIVTILDYRKGLLGPTNRVQSLIFMAREKNIPIYVDSRAIDLAKFGGADILKVNRKEYQQALKTYSCTEHTSLMNLLGIETLIVTKGKDGAIIYDQTNQSFGYSVKAPKLSGNPDVTGCGDVFDIMFSYCWGIKKMDIKSSLEAAVHRATAFTREPIEMRVKCQ